MREDLDYHWQSALFIFWNDKLAQSSCDIGNEFREGWIEESSDI